MKTVFAVEWIEVEFGQRPEGYKLFLDKGQCILDTKKASAVGAYDGGYIGPVRPLCYVEIPYDSLEEDLKGRLDEFSVTFTSNYWRPKFSGDRVQIK